MDGRIIIFYAVLLSSAVLTHINTTSPINKKPKIQLQINFPDEKNDTRSLMKISETLRQGDPKIDILSLINVQNVTEFMKNVNFKNWTSLHTLIIQDGRIEIFPDTVFAGLKKLKKLNLTHIKLKNITASLFSPLSSLDELYINHNELLSLPSNIFVNVTSLIRLDLSSNKLANLSTDTFRPLSHLILLRLDKNNIEFLDEGTFPDAFKSCLVLFMNSNNISSIHRNAFAKLTNLLNLHMSAAFNPKVKQLPSNLFSNLFSVEEMILSGNHLESLESSIFQSLKNLTKLDLSNNHITYLNYTYFANNTQLKTLNLAKNQLTHLNKLLFQNLGALEVLNLSRNELSTFDAQIFSGLFSLQNIIIEFNNVTLAGENGLSVLNSCPHIKYIKARNNSIRNIYKDWCDLQNVKIIDLRSNFITELKPNFTIQSSHLKILLDGPANSRIEWQYLLSGELNEHSEYSLILDKYKYCYSECACLIHTDFKSFKISINCTRFNKTELDDEIPVHIKQLSSKMKVEFNLSNCSLWSVNDIKPYLKQINVTGLDLSLNHLISLDDFRNSNFSSLKALKLHGNKFTTFSWNTFEFLKRTNLTLITLNDNPWSCECASENFSYYVQTHEKQILNPESLLCANPTDGKVKDFDFAGSCHELSYTLAYFFIFLTAAFGACIMIIIFYNKYEKEIKVLLYSRFPQLFHISKEPNFRYKFDGFLVYVEEDESFIKERLLVELEEGCKSFKLCYPLRDWEPGGNNVSQTYRSVQDSRRTIVILSSKFLNSTEWVHKQFEMAYMRSVNERRSCIILILLDDFGNQNELSDEMKAYLNTNTFIKYADTKWFWDKLRYELRCHSDEKMAEDA